MSEDVLALLERRGAVRHGHFRLSSGLHSDLYVQCALVCQWPDDAAMLGGALADRFAAAGSTAVLGPAMGGVIIAHEVARALGVRMVFSERVDGTMTLRRGFALDTSDRVLVVEDVVTTGRSQLEAMEVARSDGATVVGVGAIVDRIGPDLGVPFEALAHVTAQTWQPDECPLCAADEPIDAPGSRHLTR